MANFPIVEARQELGVVPVVATRARAGMRTDTAAGATGAVLGQAVLDILEQVGEERQQQSIARKAIEVKRRQMMDANSAVLADTLRRTADAEFETFKLTNSQETWETERTRQVQQVADEIGGLDFSQDALIAQQAKSALYGSVETAQALTAATRQLRTDTIEAQTQAMVDAFRIGGAKEQLEAVTRYRDNGANMGKDTVEVLNDIKAARTAGQKLRKQDVIDEWQDKIAENPVVVENILSAELEARKQDKGTIPVLESADIQSLINLANAREVQLLADTAAERNRQQRDLENDLYDGLADKTKSISDVMSSNLDAAAKRRLVNDEENFAQRDVNRTWPLVDNDLAVEQLDSQLSSLEAGVIDRTQMDRHINDTAVDGELTRETRDKFRALSKKGGRDAVDAAVKFEVDKIENALIRRFTDLESRFIIRSLERPLTQQEAGQASSNAYLLQINRHQLFLIKGEIERNMRPPVTEKDVISGVEATAIASKVWEKYRTKTLGAKINAFKEYTGQRVPRPDGFSQKVWESATDREKADIVEAVSNGLSNEEILTMIGQ
ncbi:hypothetical protein LCGC14_0928890 [marine sediment metagenome]|uniref:Uncharacterized protein n=1 Tax=marine sediment metagenome TaxID=412755 RepID=A0A0F9NNM0_9ZZZZ